MKIVVLGGSGFLGHNICKLAIAKGYEVVSVSRRGAGGLHNKEPWMDDVEWETLDAQKDPNSLLPVLRDASAVVNSVGILMENNYKKILQNPRGPVSHLINSLSSNMFKTGQNPLAPKPEEAKQSKNKVTFEAINRDLAIETAKIAAKANVPVYCYVSAHAAAPGLDPRYIKTKREAEREISKISNLRSIFLRPGFMYNSNDRPFTGALASLFSVSSSINRATSGALNFLGTASAEPLPSEEVALAALEAISDPSVKGPVEISELKSLAHKFKQKSL
ncbi:NAD dependent epimerase/dehydratase [Schizosaccharomyces pombe]